MTEGPGDRESLGSWLRQQREVAGFTQEELAERSGLSVRTIRNLERDRAKKPHLRSVRRMTRALGLAETAGGELIARYRALQGGGSSLPRRSDGDAARSLSASPGLERGRTGPVLGLVPRQLPLMTRYFVGRRAELESLTRLLDHMTGMPGALVISAIAGPAGVGKTALAVHAAHLLAERFPDGQLFLDLHGYTDGYQPRSAGAALDWLLRALGLPPRQIPQDVEQRAALYRQHLADMRTLIVLDNAASEAQVRPLLPGSAGCLVLVTSRRRLKGLDDARTLALDVLPRSDAIALLRTVAGATRVPADHPDLAETAELCGRLPLALRIAAALLRHRPAWRLEHLAGLLRGQQRCIAALTDCERELNAVFDLSYRSLTDEQQRLFRQLSLVPWPEVDGDAAAALLGTDPGTATGLLEDLVDHSLLLGQTPGRYRLHDLLRLHACALAGHDPVSDRDAALERVFDYYQHTANRATCDLQEALPLHREQGDRLGQADALARPGRARAAHETVSGLEIPMADGRWQPLFYLPAAPADFTGRQAECESVLGALAREDGVPVMAISGQPGIGKTALALRAAHQARDRFPDGQLWVQLAGVSARPRDPGEVLGELLRAFGVPGSAVPGDHAERASVFRSRVAGRRLLVVADDAASAEQVAPLLPGTPGCALIVTSRMSLEGLAGACIMPLGVMTREESVGLLGRILGPARVEADPVGVGGLAEVCGGLPLALRVAGARLAARPAWPMSAMTRRLVRPHGRLRELKAGNLSVRAGIAASYGLLPERHQRAFRFLSIPGPSDFAEWVVPALLGEPDSAGVLDDLLSRSLVTPIGVDMTGEPRYQLHDLLRDYAAERLAEEPAPGWQAAASRLLEAYLQLAREANAGLPPEPYFPPPTFTPRPAVLPAGLAGELTADPIAWFTSERQNLLAAVDQACAADQPGLPRELAEAQCAYQHLQDRHDDAERLWSLIADRSDQHDAYPRLRVGASLIERGRAAEALPILDSCVEQASDEVLALALYWRGSCACDLDDFDRARRDAGQGVAVARQAGSPLTEFLNLRLLSNGLGMTGHDAGEAVRIAESAVAIATDLGAATYEFAALYSLAYSCMLAGQYDRSIRLCHRRIELSRELGDVRGEAHCYGVLGDAYSRQGKWELAIQSLQRALPVFEEHRALRHYGLCLLKLGCAYEGLGRYPEATRYLERALQVFRQLRLPAKTELAQQALGRCQARNAR